MTSNPALWVSLSVVSVVGAGVLGVVGYKKERRREEERMDAKTIIAIVLVVFIGGAALWLNIRNRKNK